MEKVNKNPKKYHILLSRPFDLATFDSESQVDKGPRHTMSMLQGALGADVHAPGQQAPSIRDNLKSRVFPRVGEKDHWALARSLASRFSNKDTVFALGEDIGFPMAAQYQKNQSRPKISMIAQFPTRRSFKDMFWVYGMKQRIETFFVNTSFKKNFLIRNLGVHESRVHQLEEQTDTMFFRPLPIIRETSRPLIASGGLEQRDYWTLIAATSRIDVDVEICAMSPNNQLDSNIFPNPIPNNVKIGEYDWVELRNLYNRADIVVLSMKENSFQAGLTTLMEALACKRPVVMTATSGLAARFSEEGLITTVAPGDPEALVSAIKSLLDDPKAASEKAEKAYKHVVENHTADRLVEDLEFFIRKLDV
jgi:glycosyltransferase involved in cell wall biosynthesis